MSQTTIPGLTNDPTPALADLLETSKNPGSFNISIGQLSDFYQLLSLKDAANGYAGLDASSLLNVAQIPTAIPAINIADGTVDNTEFQRLNGLTSAIEEQGNKGAVSGYAGLDASQELLLANFPSGTGLQVLRRNTGNTALEFATLTDLQGITSINADTTAAQIIAGTANRITVGTAAGTTTINIDTGYVGQASITTLGTITTGVWNGTAITGANINAASTDLTDTAVIARSTNNLSFFAATTSAQLAGVISDETGSGLLVFGTSPTIVTPTIASFTNASHDHTNAAGGGQLLSTTALSDTANIAYLNTANTWTTGLQNFAAVTLRIPVSATPSVTVDGDIAYDTTVTDFSTGLIKFFGTEEQGIVAMPIAQFTTPSDGFVVSYNATNDEFELTAAGAGDMILASVQTVTGAKTFGTIGGTVDKFILAGSTSGSTILNAAAIAGTTTVTLQGVTGTVALLGDKLDAFAATTSAELATVISDETGSGLLVFGTSPTLVTPALGIPSALTLTNATGLPPAGVVGVAAVQTDNLSVFAATTSSQLAGVISDETGTGLLMFNSAATITQPLIDYSINAQTGTSYTPVLSDAGAVITSSNASAVTVTIPPNSSVAYPIGSSITIISIGVGLTSFAQGAGVTITSTGAVSTAPVLRAQHSAATAIKTATDTWRVVGDIS